MNNQKLLNITWIVIISCIILGGFLGIYLIGRETGNYNYELIIPISFGTIMGFIIHLFFSKWNKKRNGNVPDVDERNIFLLQRYFMFVLYIVLIGSGAGLLIMYAMGIYYIETGMLIVCLMVLFMLIGFGVLIVKQFG